MDVKTEAPPVGQRQTVAPMMQRAAETRPSSYREDDNSLEVVWSTGAEVTRFDWWDFEYYTEELAMSAENVRLDRMNRGAPLLDTHNSYSLRSVIGSVVPGSARIENGEGIARVRLVDTEDHKDTVAKIRDGHIRNLSVGYIVHTYTRTEKDGERPVMRADDWEPTEISFVPVPADAGAQARSRDATQGGFPCTIRGLGAAAKEDPAMDPKTTTAPATEPGTRTDPVTPAPAPAANPPATDTREAPQGLTGKRIREVCQRADLGSDFALELIERNEDTPLTEAQLTDAVAERLESKRNTKPIDQRNEVLGPVGGDKFRTAFEASLLSRGKRPSEVEEDAKMLRGMGLSETARLYLEMHGQRTFGMDKFTLFKTAFRFGAHGTSDFATGLANVANKSLLDGYNTSEQTFWAFTQRTTLKDFTDRSAVGLAGVSPFQLVLENAEFKRGRLIDYGDTMKLATYGEIIAITRQAIINDDIGLFTDIPKLLGVAAADHESDSIYALLTGNPTMYDGTALFHADHGNLAASGTAITIASISAGRAAMRKQTDEGGKPISGLYPKYLVVGPDKQTEAEQLVAAVVASDNAKVNPFSGRLEPVVDPRITGNEWYLLADKNRSGIVSGYLEGQEEVFLDTREGFDVDGTEWKARLDHVGKAIDWRGAYKNPGA